MLNVPAWAAIDVYTFIVLGITAFALITLSHDRDWHRVYFLGFVITLVVLVCADICSFAYLYGNITISLIGNFVYFGFDPIALVFWAAYASTWIGDQTLGNPFPKNRFLFIFTCGFAILNLTVTVIGMFTGWLFFYDLSGSYQRGPLFGARVLAILFTAIAIEIYLFVIRKRMPLAAYSWVAALAILPIAGSMLQALFANLTFELAGYAIGLFILYVRVQSTNVSVDPLTGVNTRGTLGVELRRRIKHGAREPFSAIMIDIDEFKQINDLYGHQAGDRALAVMGNVLTRSARSGDFVSRYGGDEFFILSDVCTVEMLESMVMRIRHTLADENEHDDLPFEMRASFGYVIFDPEVDKNPDAFIARVDTLLYEEKRIAKSDTEGARR
jgi:diguanylate cyclase (GGDEF)-like protein